MHYRTALVTGASSGIGQELARGLARQGTRVVLCARRAADLARLADEIGQAGGAARAEPLDVADTQATAAALRRIDEEEGGLDLVVANAGVSFTVPARTMTWEALEAMCQVNFTGAICTLTAVLPAMLARGSGHLVGVSSLAAYSPYPGSAAYCASKAGLSMFLRGLREELQGTGVQVTTVQPGFVDTPMTKKNRFPMPFLMTAEDAAALLLRRLPSAPAVIDFPLPTAIGARTAALLPRELRALVLSRVTRR